MTKQQVQTLTKLVSVCSGELHTHPERLHFPHWSFVTSGHTVLAKGVNRRHEPPRHYGYHSLFKSPTYRPKWHAELDALTRYGRRGGKIDVVNVRLNRGGHPRMAMPCRACRDFMRMCNVNKVYFTTEVGWGLLKL